MVVLKANGKNITPIAGNISLRSSLDALGDELDFEIAFSNLKYYPNISVNTGDIIQLFSGSQEVFRGIIVTKTRAEHSQSFNCFDFAFYLNKSKVIKQFNKVAADVAIKKLLEEFSVPVGEIASMPTIIKKIYYDKEVSAVIKDVLEQVTNSNGAKYVMEMKGGKLNIYKDTDLLIDLKIKVADNLAPVSLSSTISNPTKSASIEEMKNSIKLYIGGEEGVKIYAETKSDNLVKKYGLLQETQSIENKDIAQAKNIANNLLKELGKVIVSGSIEVLGHFDLRAGRILNLNEPITNLTGRYKIQSASHTISGGTHKTSLDLTEV